MRDDGNPLGGRITLGVVGAIGGGALYYALTFPSAAGIGTYAAAGAFGLAGLAAIRTAVVDPERLDITTRASAQYERRVDDPTREE